VATLPNGDLILAHNDDITGNLFFLRGPTPAALAAASPQQVTTSGNIDSLFIVASGKIVIFFYYWGGAGVNYYQRYDSSTGTFLDASPVAISGPNGLASGNIHAAVDSAGDVWVAFTDAGSTRLSVLRLNLATNIWDQPVGFTNDTFGRPLVLAAEGVVWVFWNDALGIKLVVWSNSAWSGPSQVPQTIAGDQNPVGAIDSSNELALAFNHPLPSSSHNISISRGNPSNGAWSVPSSASTPNISSSNDVVFPSTGGLIEAGGSLWLVWTRYFGGDSRVYYRQIFYPL
jgi:hypothetical protein